jgi:hypothetical protein
MITKTTTHLRLAPRRAARWLDRQQIPRAILLPVLVFIVAGSISAINRLGSFAAAPAIPTPTLPIVLIQTATPAPIVPTPAAVVNVLPPVRYVTAWAAPDGDVLGPIPAPRLADVLARYGDTWVMVPWEAGQVWVRAADVGLPNVADIAPHPRHR